PVGGVGGLEAGRLGEEAERQEDHGEQHDHAQRRPEGLATDRRVLADRSAPGVEDGSRRAVAGTDPLLRGQGTKVLVERQRGEATVAQHGHTLVDAHVTGRGRGRGQRVTGRSQHVTARAPRRGHQAPPPPAPPPAPPPPVSPPPPPPAPPPGAGAGSGAGAGAPPPPAPVITISGRPGTWMVSGGSWGAGCCGSTGSTGAEGSGWTCGAVV